MRDGARHDADAPGRAGSEGLKGELGDGPPDRLRVAILAAGRSDGDALARALARWGVPTERVRDVAELVGVLAADRADLAVLTGETLTERGVQTLRAHTERRPAWDTLPLIVLVEGRGNTPGTLARLQKELPQAKLLVLQRPLREAELASALTTMRTARERQYALRDHIAQQEELRRELNHRVKNILSTVQAVYALSTRHAADAEAFHATYATRLNAMARLHDVLFSGDYGATSLREALMATLAPYGAGTDDGPVSLEGNDIVVPADAAQNLGLIVHELATNAAKYGALSHPAGRVALGWRTGDRSLKIEWRERGGPPVGEPRTRGYGTRFIDATIKQMRGSVERRFGDDGLEVRLSLPFGDLGRRASDAQPAERVGTRKVG